MHAEDVGVVLLVGGEHGDEDLHFVLEPFREQRADRAVDEAAGENLLVRRPSLALEKPTGDLARRVRLLAILDGQGKERKGGDVGGDGYCRQDHRVAEPQCRGARGLSRQSPGLDREWAASELGFDPLHGHYLLSLFSLWGSIVLGSAIQRGRPDWWDQDAPRGA